jgi:hypothetical protein
VADNPNGSPSYDGTGGAILNFGTLTIDSVTIGSNVPMFASGGIFSSGTLTASGCAVTGNFAGYLNGDQGKGGGIFNDAHGHLTIFSSVVRNNTASYGADICDLG